MTEDNNIPDGVDEFEANKFIRETDDRIHKKADRTGRKLKNKHGAAYWECPTCKTNTSDKDCPICGIRTKNAKIAAKWGWLEDWKQEAVQGFFGLLFFAAMVWVGIIVWMSVVFISNGFRF